MMKKILKALAFLGISLSLVMCSSKPQVIGAGSSFIYPALAKWADTYQKSKAIQINYQPIGSGGGLRQIYTNTVDFAATDEPLTADSLKEKNLIQFPLIIGGIVPVVNVSGISADQLVLSGPVLADIYLGKITLWDAPAIQKLNPGLKLPHKVITTVHRSDGSGTTFNFSNYLGNVSKEAEQKLGANSVVAFPGQNSVGAKGNAGVASQVMTLPNSIGYVEYAYAMQNHMVTTKMINRSGRVVAANEASFVAAALNAKWDQKKGFYQILTNQSGNATWPIVATTFILISTSPRNPAATNAALQFFSWAYESGTDIALNLDYVSIPKTVYTLIENSWKSLPFYANGTATTPASTATTQTQTGTTNTTKQ
jgi:phosphate transport system substrate-binding protein